MAKKSEVIKNMIEGRIYKKDCGIEDEIPLTNVSSKCLKKVLEYCEHHRKDEPEEIPKPLKTCNLAELVSEYDAKFIDIDDLEGIFDIIMADTRGVYRFTERAGAAETGERKCSGIF